MRVRLWTRQVGDLLQKTPSLKTRWSHVGHETNWWNYISIFTRLMGTNCGSMMTSCRRFRTQTPKSSSTFRRSEIKLCIWLQEFMQRQTQNIYIKNILKHSKCFCRVIRSGEGSRVGRGAYGTVHPVFKNYWKVLFLHRKSDKKAPFSKHFAKTPFFKELYPTTLKLLPPVMICNPNWKNNTYIYKDAKRRKLLKNAVE